MMLTTSLTGPMDTGSLADAFADTSSNDTRTANTPVDAYAVTHLGTSNIDILGAIFPDIAISSDISSDIPIVDTPLDTSQLLILFLIHPNC